MTQTQHKQQVDPQKQVDDFNAKYAVGSPVTAYPGCLGGDALHTKTTSKAFVLGGHTAVVMVEGHPAAIALSHINPLNE